MALYKPTQRFDFLYIRDHQKIYLKVTVLVPLDIKEVMPSPPPADINDTSLSDIQITLRAMGTTSAGEVEYVRTLDILVDVRLPGLEKNATEEQIRDNIGENEYTVTSRVYKDGAEKGKVTTISKNEDIEIL